MYELTVNARFAAAHRLREYCGECENLHGHNWNVTARVTASELNEEGMVVDFRKIKEVLGQAVDRLDHKYLNDIEPFTRLNPTTEHIAAFLARCLADGLPEGVSVKSVTCWESSDSGATYYPEEQSVPQPAGKEDIDHG